MTGPAEEPAAKAAPIGPPPSGTPS
jgi:hypothetical protein